MVEEYTRRRLERIGIDAAVTRSKVENIEKDLSGFLARTAEHERRLGKLERRMFGLWMAGPVLVGAAVFLQNFKTWLMGR